MQTEFNKQLFASSGFLFYCAPGLALGTLFSENFIFSALSAFVSVTSFSNASEFWRRVLFQKDFARVKLHLLISNTAGVLTGLGYIIFIIPLFAYLLYFAFSGVYEQIMVDMDKDESESQND